MMTVILNSGRSFDISVELGEELVNYLSGTGNPSILPTYDHLIFYTPEGTIFVKEKDISAVVPKHLTSNSVIPNNSNSKDFGEALKKNCIDVLQNAITEANCKID